MLNQEMINELEKEYQDDEWRLHFHLMPPVGWLNDPNGLCQFHGIYHIYYQYAPKSAKGTGGKCWGHYTTKDFVTFFKEKAPLLPDSDYDLDGVYSGSAFVENNIVHYVYTGNRKYQGNYDYIYNGRGHHTMYVSSCDGYDFSEKICLMENKDYPHDLSCHVRDPKIFKEKDIYYMVLGARTLNDQGCVLVYRSQNLKNWTYIQRIETKAPFGYMWECPDLFEIDGQKILITCPQGIDTKGIHYENIYQNGYFLINGDIEKEYQLSCFTELDYGFDFYAPQTFMDEKGRRILIGWLGLPDIPYTNPTVKNGWQHALTLPRELSLKNNKIYQYPIEETKQLRKNHLSCHLSANELWKCQSRCFEMKLSLNNLPFTIQLRKDIELLYDKKVLTFKMGQSGYGRDERHIEIDSIDNLTIFNDTSSIEIFINAGEKVITSRVYDQDIPVIQTSLLIDMEYYDLDSYKIETKKAS